MNGKPVRTIGMIPARLGSQRLARKNLRTLQGVSLLAGAIRRCRASSELDEVWVNSEADEFAAIADEEGAHFHRRPASLANDSATSEDFVYEFLQVHECDYLVQVHSIAPLLRSEQIDAFVARFRDSGADVMLSVVQEQIECFHGGIPINFSFERKQNSQDLVPVSRVTWSITGWRRDTYLQAHRAGECATYAGEVELFQLDRAAGHVIKTEEDLRFAEALLRNRE